MNCAEDWQSTMFHRGMPLYSRHPSHVLCMPKCHVVCQCLPRIQKCPWINTKYAPQIDAKGIPRDQCPWYGKNKLDPSMQSLVLPGHHSPYPFGPNSWRHMGASCSFTATEWCFKVMILVLIWFMPSSSLYLGVWQQHSYRWTRMENTMTKHKKMVRKRTNSCFGQIFTIA